MRWGELVCPPPVVLGRPVVLSQARAVAPAVALVRRAAPGRLVALARPVVLARAVVLGRPAVLARLVVPVRPVVLARPLVALDRWLFSPLGVAAVPPQPEARGRLSWLRLVPWPVLLLPLMTQRGLVRR